jgi:hypothetical protein
VNSVSSAIGDEDFVEVFLPYGSFAGVQTLIGWYCTRCGVLVPNITDMPPDQARPLDVHRAHHQLGGR